MGARMLSPPPHCVATFVRTGDRCRSDRCRLVSALMSTFHEFAMTSITGDQVSFDRFRDQLCLVVNVASA